jgi:hypothetical protein
MSASLKECVSHTVTLTNNYKFAVSYHYLYLATCHGLVARNIFLVKIIAITIEIFAFLSTACHDFIFTVYGPLIEK